MKEFLRKLFFTFIALLVFVGGLSFYNLYRYQSELIAEIDSLRVEFTGKDLEHTRLKAKFDLVYSIQDEIKNIEHIITSVNPSLTRNEIKLWVNSLRDNTDLILSTLNSHSKLKIAPDLSEKSFKPGIALLMSLAAFESDFYINSRSKKDAYGPMQLRQVAADHIGVANRENPLDNINGGARFLASLLKSYQNYPDQLELALASYNAGTGRVRKTWIPNWGERWENIKIGLISNKKRFLETRNYVNSILAMTHLLVSGKWSDQPPVFWRGYKLYARNYDLAAIFDYTSDPLEFK